MEVAAVDPANSFSLDVFMNAKLTGVRPVETGLTVHVSQLLLRAR